jgi:hypothetical protein
MDWNRIKDDIGILIFSAILAFVIVLSVAGMLNTERILDYRIYMAQKEMQEVYHGTK